MNPYCEDDVPAEEAPEPKLPTIQKTPSVWPVFVTFVIMVGVHIGLIITLAVAWVLWQIVNGANPQQLGNDLMGLLTPEGLMIPLAGGQVVVGVFAVIGAWFLRQPVGASLGLGKPAVPVWSYPVVIIGVVVPGAVGAGLATALALLIPADETLEKLFDQLTWANGPLFVAVISVLPGFFEELFFRGYMQRRLLQAWAPWQAIVVTSALFAVLHLNPHQSLFAFFIGLGFGVIAWRTGSIWLCVFAHAMWNAGSVCAAVALKHWGLEDDPPLIPLAIGGVIALVCCVASIWIFRQQPAPAIVAPEISQDAPEETRFETERERSAGDAYTAD